MDELPTDPKRTCAEKEARAKGKAVQTLHESHKEKQIRSNMTVTTVATEEKV